jgi:site-specific DNA-methyltransferase (adenine-specific)
MAFEKIEIGNAILYHGDCLEVCKEIEYVDSIVCDPPYHLTSVANRLKKTSVNGGTDIERRANGRSDGIARLARGFMGQEWDGGDIAFRPETWEIIGKPLRPGGFLLAFGGTRRWHRLACAIEDAGFVIQDNILDLIASDTRLQRLVETLSPEQINVFSQILDDLQLTGLLSWLYGEGFPKNKAMLCPAWEPVILAYKPGGKRELQIDECRIETDGRPLRVGDYKETNNHVYSGRVNGDETFRGGSASVGNTKLGRWPKNVCHDGSDEVIKLLPQSFGQQGDIRGTEPSSTGDNGIYGHFDRVPFSKRNDSGSAARFFYCAKADENDRMGSKHPTIKPQALMRWLVALVTPPNGVVLDPFAGSGSTAQAALAVGRKPIVIEKEDQWFNDAVNRVKSLTKTGLSFEKSNKLEVVPIKKKPGFEFLNKRLQELAKD